MLGPIFQYLVVEIQQLPTKCMPESETLSVWLSGFYRGVTKTHHYQNLIIIEMKTKIPVSWGKIVFTLFSFNVNFPILNFFSFFLTSWKVDNFLTPLNSVDPFLERLKIWWWWLKWNRFWWCLTRISYGLIQGLSFHSFEIQWTPKISLLSCYKCRFMLTPK